MTSRVLAAVIAAGCVTAAAGGAYLAVRQNQAESRMAAPASPAPAQAAPAPAVTETETVVETPAAAPDETYAPPVAGVRETSPAVGRRRAPVQPDGRTMGAPRRPAAAAVPEPAIQDSHPAPLPAAERPAPQAAPAPMSEPELSPPADVRAAPRERLYEELVVPASSVLGLRVDTPLTSERARVEDRVDAHVSRDVTVDGRLAIPSGSRVVGSVTLVERGGKMKDRARLGVRFHTLVLADGREVPLRTEPIVREGDSPANESARKIGGAAIGGAILGAIMGGGKGAVMGGAAGAAGGSASVMAGDRNAATLPSGTVVSVRLSAPAAIETERQP